MNVELSYEKHPYTITPKTTREVFKASNCSPERLNSLAAFDFAEECGGTFWNLKRALLTRLAFHQHVQRNPETYNTAEKKDEGLQNTHRYTKTGTVRIALMRKGLYVCAFADLDNKEQARQLIEAGYTAHSKGDKLILSEKDARICDLIEQAEQTKRIASALKKNPTLISVKEEGKQSKYKKNQYAVAAFGPDAAEWNAKYLLESGFEAGRFWDYTDKEFATFLTKGQAEVCSVGLGGVVCGNFIVDAVDGFYYSGWARSVVHVGGAQNSPSEKKVRKVRA